MAGTPPTIAYGGTSLVTTAPAKTTPLRYSYSFHNRYSSTYPTIISDNLRILIYSISINIFVKH